MLQLVFQIGADRHALPAAAIAEICALVELHPVAGAPAGVAGVFNYHGRAIPAVDLSMLVLGRASSPRWSTRILLHRLARPAEPTPLVGLIAEHATELVALDPPAKDEAGGLLRDAQGTIRPLRLEQLLPPDTVRFLETEHSLPPAHPQPPVEPVAAPDSVEVEVPVAPEATSRRRRPRTVVLARPVQTVARPAPEPAATSPVSARFRVRRPAATDEPAARRRPRLDYIRAA